MNDNDLVLDDWRHDAEVHIWEIASFLPESVSRREFWEMLAAEALRQAANHALTRGEGPPFNREQAFEDLQRILDGGPAIESQEWLTARWRCSSGATSKWLSAWEAEGLVARTRRGRVNIIMRPS